MSSKPNQELASAIKKYIDRKKISTSALAKRCGIPYSTFRDIKEENNSSRPDPENALSISVVCMSRSERSTFIKKFYPIIGKLMGDEETIEPEFQKIGLDWANGYLEREPHNFIFNLVASKQNSITIDEIRSLKGQKGLDAVDELIDQDILKIDNGRLNFGADTWEYQTPADAIRQLKFSTDHIDQSLCGTPGATVFYLTGSLKPEKVHEIKSILVEATEKIKQIKNDQRNKGPVSFFAGGYFSIFNKKHLESLEGPTKDS